MNCTFLFSHHRVCQMMMIAFLNSSLLIILQFGTLAGAAVDEHTKGRASFGYRLPSQEKRFGQEKTFSSIVGV